MSNDYIDARSLAPRDEGCLVRDCHADLDQVDSQWGRMPYCPLHCIRIHRNTKTFVYYHGADSSSKRNAAMRNIVFERDYFAKHILGNAGKAESHRISHET